jgi:hypothetical protein
MERLSSLFNFLEVYDRVEKFWETKFTAFYLPQESIIRRALSKMWSYDSKEWRLRAHGLWKM